MKRIYFSKYKILFPGALFFHVNHQTKRLGIHKLARRKKGENFVLLWPGGFRKIRGEFLFYMRQNSMFKRGYRIAGLKRLPSTT